MLSGEVVLCVCWFGSARLVPILATWFIQTNRDVHGPDGLNTSPSRPYTRSPNPSGEIHPVEAGRSQTHVLVFCQV